MGQIAGRRIKPGSLDAEVHQIRAIAVESIAIYDILYVSGTEGVYAKVSKASSAAAASATGVLYMSRSTVPAGGQVLATAIGVIKDVNTSSGAVGDTAYLSTSGQPAITPGLYARPIGSVIKVGVAGTGEVLFNGYASSQAFRDGTVLQLFGSGTTPGDTVVRYGATATEGLEVRVFENTISPAAVETAIVTLPAYSYVLAVQANCQSALTGGGTTVTWSIGTAADPDKYGTAGNGAGDTLAKNGKLDFAIPGTLLTSTEAIVLTGAAAGGAADGNTALTVGSVRVRVVYAFLNSLDDAP